jgi:hypothetical protein
MQSSACVSCEKTKAPRRCGLCQSALCKNCSVTIPEGGFSCLHPIPEKFSQPFYCPACFTQDVAPELATYETIFTRAKDVFVFSIAKHKQTRLIRRSKILLSVEGCADKQEAVLKLAYLAAKENFNSIIDVEIICEKVRMGAYQTSKWNAKGVPVHMDAEKLQREYEQQLLEE